MNVKYQPRDINKLPTSEGLYVFGISMSRIGNDQSAKKMMEYLNWLDTKIHFTDGIGCVIWYSDYLYFNSNDPAVKLRNRYKQLMISHKNELLKLMDKERIWIKKAFSFQTFGNILLENSNVFQDAFRIVEEMYKTDDKFKELVDFESLGTKSLGSSFILEEITFFYLMQKGNLRLGNTFVSDSEKNWILQCYPGKPLLSEIYLFRKNPLQLNNPKNIYQDCFYDIESKLLFDYSKLDFEKYVSEIMKK